MFLSEKQGIFSTLYLNYRSPKQQQKKINQEKEVRGFQGQSVKGCTVYEL